jgi:glutathione synthase/RimK-type ligase-like ATP-grasp enzyme
MPGMKRCAYLVMEDPGDYVTDYHLSFDAMAEAGWQVDCVPWRDPAIDWERFDAVYICTPWDYPDDPERFMQVLATIDESTAALINPLALVRWTLTKTYLGDLEQQGGAVVASLWFDAFDPAAIDGWFAALGSDKVVIKPAVGANAQDTYVLTRPVASARVAELRERFTGRAFFVQPFMASIQSEGEYSLFFFGGKYSHAILKTPAPGDFRSQEEHGADIQSIDATPEQIVAAEKLLALVEPQPTYARVDLVRDDAGRYRLMELELIEPSLYLRTDPGSAARFARAFDAAYQKLARPGRG